MEGIRRLIISVIIIILSLPAMTQEEKKLTLEDLIPGGATNHRFVPQNLYGLKWKGTQVVNYDTGDEVMKEWFSVSGMSSSAILLKLEQVNDVLKKNKLRELVTLDNLSFPDENRFLVSNTDYYALCSTDEVVWKLEFSKKAVNKDLSLESHALAYTLDNNLWIATPDKNIAVTNEPTGIECGKSVHRNEFGIGKGTFWSPDGNRLAFYRMDERMVTDYPLVDISPRIAQLKNIKYPMAGMTSHQVTIGVYDLSADKTIYLDAGDPTDRYFTNIQWSPDGTKIFVIELNRDQNHAQLVCYNTEDGKREAVLYEERHDKYVEPESPILFVKGNNKQFIYQSQRDGFNHLYLYTTDGKFIKQLTSGEWIVQSVLGFDENGKNLFYMSTEESPLESHLYRLNLKTGKRIKLTKEAGVHQIILSPCTRYAIDRYSSHDVPRIINVIGTNDGKVQKTLLTADNPFKDYQTPEIECGKIKAADGETDLYYRLVKPTDFDPNKKYPAIIYVYGGPHLQLIHNSFNWDARGWDIYMAQNGYVVFSLDNRGSANRGLEFENATFRQLGIEEGKDQMEGISFLKSLSYVDMGKLGVHGWSFGGHMTTSLLLRYPGVFKAGVAGGPVIDWEYYEIMYGERYMDTPESNPEGYEKCNLNNLAGNLKDRLLLIHDDEDNTCVMQHTLSFMKACVNAFTFPDLFIYPGHGHNVRGRDRVHLYEKITRYFEDNIKK